MEVLIDERALTARVQEMGAMIRRDYGADTPVHLVAVLKGAFMFLADLMRTIEGPVTCDFIAVSSYGARMNSSGEVRLTKDLDRVLQGRDVIVVEDIVDSGLTLSYLQEILRAREPRSLRTACLLSKPSRRTVDVAVEYIGFTIEDRFVVGYGLDFDERHRNLPYIGVLEGESYVPARRFDILTESDARHIERGSTVEVEARGRVTPLARETLADRGVTVVWQDPSDAVLPAGLVPATNASRVAIGADHGGVALKATLVDDLRSTGIAVTDLGTHGTAPVDYPDIAAAVAKAVVRGDADAGIVIDGAGLGSAIAANKIRGIRAAMCTSVLLARYAREHNGANVLTLGATLVTADLAKEIVRTWLSTPMSEPRYIRRLLKVRRLEEAF